VQTDPHLRREAMFPALPRQPPLDLLRAGDGRPRVGERNEEAVPGVIDLLATV
jgi:hypothetical protein